MLSALNECPNAFKPYIDSSTNALNPCFVSLVNMIQGIIFCIIGAFQLIELYRDRKAPIKTNYFSVSARFLQQISNIGLQGTLIACELIFISRSTEVYPRVLRSSLLTHLFLILFISFPTTYLQYFKSTCAIGNQLFYYMFQIFVLSLQIALRVVNSPDERFNLIRGQMGAIFEAAILINSLLIFANDFYFYKPSVDLIAYYDERNYQHDVNIIQAITFTWMNGLITDSYREGRIPNPHSLPVPPANLNIKRVSKKLQRNWEEEKWKGRKSLFRALLNTFGKSILIAISFETLKDLLSVLQPQLLRIFIQCFNENGEENQPPIHGFFIAFGLFFVSVLSTVLQNHFYIKIFEVGLGMRGSLIALTYQKSLRLSLSSREKSSGGDIINMISTDVYKIQKFFEDCQVVIGAPIQAIIVLISLYWLLGKAIFAGLVTMAIMMPINTLISKKVEKLYKIQMGYKDARLKTTNEILSSMKSIKLYAWEKPMLDKLNHVRNDLEIANFKKIGIISNLIFFLWNSVPLIVTCSTFGIFSITSGIPLSPELVFPSLSLFDILNDVIYSLPNTINSVIETKVSMNRLGKFLLSEELDDSFLYFEEESADKSIPVVEIKNASFLWSSMRNIEDTELDDVESTIESPKIALYNIDGFRVAKGSITCIVGKVGSGKSTLIRAILGQLPCISADKNSLTGPQVIIRASSIAYCAQQPWIVNATIKENILFGHRFDENFYQATISACQLLIDLKILPNGDETLVGEKGISLSGGQKARISLARAVYARADLYILDDVLSAVDAEVRTNIINKVLDERNGLLKNKTVILATNTISVLKHSQIIYVLQMGYVVETGTYNEAISSDETPILHRLINEFDSNLRSTADPKMNIQKSNIDGSLELKDAQNSCSLSPLTEISEEVTNNLNSRRASMETFKSHCIVDYEDVKKPGAIQSEKISQGRVKFSVYMFYIKACGTVGCSLFFAFMILGRILDLAENLWLKRWSEDNEEHGSNQHVLKFVGVYAAIGLGSAAFNNLRTIVMLLFCSIKGSVTLHDTMAKAVMRAPMTFFETTPIGRILNRFSSDIQAIDSSLQWVFSFFFRSIFNYLLTVILISYNMPLFLVFNTLLLVVYLYYQTYFITLSRELKRLNSISISPIMSLVGESLEGHVVINAFKQFDRFNFQNFGNVQFNVNCNFHLRSTNRWLSVRLQTIGALTVLITALLALSSVNTSSQITSGMVGLLMSYALQITNSLVWIIRMSVQIETNIVSVERIHEYCNLPSEAADILVNKRVDKDWPAEGRIVFRQYCTRYREGLPLSLKNLTMEIKPQEKIGIVGRTGAGKSTLSLALFRLLEAAEGSIEIDGVDISSIGLTDLRSHLGIIPQEAEAFEGTVRSNLDPFNQYSEDELWKAIEVSHLKPHIARMLENDEESSQLFDRRSIFEAKIKGQGSNLSAGERQLLCLSRALLNKSKILVLDEATAAVDMETDRIIQDTIRSEFNDRTILTIAHRLDTVLDCDRIIVLDKGEIKEFDTPAKLLSDKNSMFYMLHQKSA